MKYKVTLKDKVYEVEVERGEAMIVDEYAAYAPAQTVKAAAAAPVASADEAPAAPEKLTTGDVVKAPMPGNILKILVSKGQKVNEGDALIILEAMKMENEIVATKAGTVAQIAVSTGTVVETGAPLVVIA